MRLMPLRPLKPDETVIIEECTSEEFVASLDKVIFPLAEPMLTYILNQEPTLVSPLLLDHIKALSPENRLRVRDSLLQHCQIPVC